MKTILLTQTTDINAVVTPSTVNPLIDRAMIDLQGEELMCAAGGSTADCW